MNVLLLVVGIVFSVSVIVGYRRGFVKIATSLISTLLCLILVIFISPIVSGWIQESTPLKGKVQDKCIEMLTPDREETNEYQETEIPREEQINLIEEAKLPGIVREMLLENNNSEVYVALGVETFAGYIGAYVTKVIADILAFLITFIVIFIVVRIILGMLNIVDKIPLVGGVNRTVGAIHGAAVGMVIIWIFFIIITLLYNTSFGATCLDSIAENKVLSWLYNNNILMNSITKFQ